MNYTNRMHYFFYFTFLLIFFSNAIFAQKTASKKDFDFFCKVFVEEKEQKFEVQVEFGNEKLRSHEDVANIHLIYQIVPSFEGGTVKAMDTIALNTANVSQIGENFYTSFSLDNKQEWAGNVLIVRIFHTKTLSNAFQILRLENTQKLTFSLQSKYKKRFNQTILADDSLKFESNNSQKITVFRFKNNFEPALPPMQTQNSKKKKAVLEIDSLFVLPTNQFFSLQTEGLYFAQVDTSSKEGLGFLVTNKNFPKYRRAEDLLATVVYIASLEETYQLSRSKQKKPALDRFWFQISGEAENAKRLIKRYYDRIEYANRSFTSYKEGWKTDRGMIYVIFGKPDYINRKNDSEEWVYDSESKNFQNHFVFQKKDTVFSDNSYDLLRDAKYRSIWYEAVEMWRKGKID